MGDAVGTWPCCISPLLPRWPICGRSGVRGMRRQLRSVVALAGVLASGCARHLVFAVPRKAAASEPSRAWCAPRKSRSRRRSAAIWRTRAGVPGGSM